MNAAAPRRTVHCTDGPAWLRAQTLPPDHALLTSLPDHTELRRATAAEWERWFVDTAELVVRSTAPTSVAIFYQTDVRRDGVWIDKAFLVQRAALAAGARLLWHRIVCRAPAGTPLRGRPGYAHLLCFSREFVDDQQQRWPDVLPGLGVMTWPRAMGTAAIDLAVGWLRAATNARVVVDPFCGLGTALAVANRHGLDAIGVERSPVRAERARTLAC